MKRYFAPLRNPALMGVVLLLTISISWILALNDPTAIRKSIGIAKFYHTNANEAIAANDQKVTSTNNVESAFISPTLAKTGVGGPGSP